MPVRKITIRTTTQRVGRGYRVRTTVNDGRTTRTQTKTVYPR